MVGTQSEVVRAVMPRHKQAAQAPGRSVVPGADTPAPCPQGAVISEWVTSKHLSTGCLPVPKTLASWLSCVVLTCWEREGGPSGALPEASRPTGRAAPPEPSAAGPVNSAPKAAEGPGNNAVWCVIPLVSGIFIPQQTPLRGSKSQCGAPAWLTCPAAPAPWLSRRKGPPPCPAKVWLCLGQLVPQHPQPSAAPVQCFPWALSSLAPHHSWEAADGTLTSQMM